nr:N-formylglutamate amidohydrolase [Sphingomonas rubra]
MQRGFDQHGGDDPASPVIVSVPHAGRDYPATLLAALRVPVAALVMLEDRHVDAVALAARGAETLLVQRRGRAWIDLNRSEHERDPRVDTGASATARASAKLRSGLGLVPLRAGRTGELWRGRFAGVEIDARIAADHRPYHDRLAALLAAARARHGAAVLLDLHSMPPLGSGRPQVVIGDRHGTSAGASLVARVEAAAAGFRVARNAPYAGGHVTERHGDPARGIHAIQLELDRALYLDAALDQPGDGLARTAALVRRVVTALEREIGWPLSQAAE